MSAVRLNQMISQKNKARVHKNQKNHHHRQRKIRRAHNSEIHFCIKEIDGSNEFFKSVAFTFNPNQSVGIQVVADVELHAVDDDGEEEGGQEEEETVEHVHDERASRQEK